ncbi:hypothetical protein Tco_0618234 [Tanacetum coccineum]
MSYSMVNPTLMGNAVVDSTNSWTPVTSNTLFAETENWQDLFGMYTGARRLGSNQFVDLDYASVFELIITASTTYCIAFRFTLLSDIQRFIIDNGIGENKVYVTVGKEVNESVTLDGLIHCHCTNIKRIDRVMLLRASGATAGELVKSYVELVVFSSPHRGARRSLAEFNLAV